MLLLFNYSSVIGTNELIGNNFSFQYKLNDREYFFENEKTYFFLISNANIKSEMASIFSEDVSDIELIKSSLKGDYFGVFVEKLTSKITVIRDESGINTGYYYNDSANKKLVISSLMHDILQFSSFDFSEEAVFQFLYSDYLWDGQTFYKQINEFELGGKYTFDNNLQLVEKTKFEITFDDTENDLSEAQNISSLREKIVEAHKKYVNDENVVLLSGGIDSVAIIIALDDLLEKKRIKAHSYKVKNAINADETVYAKSIADHLDIAINVFETELKQEISPLDFENLMLKMNNPYMGVHIFNNNFEDDDKITYYAGQDTRLHTPSVNKVDLLAFSLINKPRIVLKILNGIMHIIRPMLKLFKKSKNRKLRGLLRTTYIFDINTYVYKYYFKLDKSYLQSYGLPLDSFNEFKNNYQLDLSTINNERGLYNAIVALKWKEQYVSDIRYLQDMARINNSYMAMPFYDMNIAKYKARIPFKLAIKTMLGRAEFGETKKIVYKYLLRMSLKDKIEDKTFYRSKAAPATFYVIFNEGLSNTIKSILISDLNSERSFVAKYKLEKFINKFMNKSLPWKEEDQGYLLKLYNTAAMICYYNKAG